MLITRRSRRHHGEPDDAGISLVEVLVAMVISSVVAATALTYMFSAVGSARRADGQAEQAAAARTVLDSWAILTRLAVAANGSSTPGVSRFVSIAPTTARFCAALETKGGAVIVTVPPQGIELSLVAGQLVEKRWPTCSAMANGGGTPVRRILAPHASRVGSAWLLTPFAPLTPTQAVTAGLLTSGLVVGEQPVSATDLKLVTGVQLAFQILPDPARPAPAATYSTFVALTAGS